MRELRERPFQMKRNLRISEAAELLGTSERTIYRLIGECEIAAFKVRGSLRIPEESLEEFRRRQIMRFQEENGDNSLSDCDRL
jgi:excisionase family DNA binding protein